MSSRAVSRQVNVIDGLADLAENLGMTEEDGPDFGL